jgi:hypothetical protein
VTYLAVTGLSQSHGRRRGPGRRDEGNLGAIGIIELAVGDWNPETAPQTAIQCGGTKSIDQPRGPAGSDHSRRHQTGCHHLEGARTACAMKPTQDWGDVHCRRYDRLLAQPAVPVAIP